MPAPQSERHQQLAGLKTIAGDFASGQPPRAGASRAPGPEAQADTAELSSVRDFRRPQATNTMTTEIGNAASFGAVS